MLESSAHFNLVKSQSLRRQLLNRSGHVALELIFPEDGKIRARRVVTRSRARPTGKYPSWKMGRMMQWESHNELNAFRLLDATPAVIAYHEQPLMLRYTLDGEQHLHYPDVLVQWHNYRELWEIKPAAEAMRPEYVERTRFLQNTLPELGFSYHMVLAEELAKQPRLETVLTLLSYGRAPMSELSQERMRKLLEEGVSLTWGAALDGSLGEDGRAVVARLALQGDLACDLEKPLTRATLFNVPTPRSKDTL